MTNKTISLTIPNDDPIALHEFGAAMQRMAGRHGLEVPQTVVQRETHTVGDVERVLVDADKAQLAALGAETGPDYPDGPEFEGWGDRSEPSAPDLIVTSSPQVDSDGLPWDARIHASSKERNADGTWRARRKPSDMDAGQWAEFQGQVRTELRALMELPVEPSLDTSEQYAKAWEEHYGTDDPRDELTPVVVEPVEPEPIVVTPPPVVAPPAPVEPVVLVAPPVPAPTGTGPTEFVPFLQWITSSGITPEQVNVALAQHGLTAVPQLQQRPDLIPQVHATLAAGVSYK